MFEQEFCINLAEILILKDKNCVEYSILITYLPLSRL